MADAVQSPSSDQFTVDDLRGIALLALVIAHGADSDLDPREGRIRFRHEGLLLAGALRPALATLSSEQL